jgi:hypothetical protein
MPAGFALVLGINFNQPLIGTLIHYKTTDGKCPVPRRPFTLTRANAGVNIQAQQFDRLDLFFFLIHGSIPPVQKDVI